jgi:hypothetical protein
MLFRTAGSSRFGYSSAACCLQPDPDDAAPLYSERMNLFQIALLTANLALVVSVRGNIPGTRARLAVETNFEGASADGIRIDEEARSIEFTPGGDPARGWPCWWYFKINGVEPGEAVTLRLRASSATTKAGAGPLSKPLSAAWAMPERSTYSNDGVLWRQSEKGVREGEVMLYTLRSETRSIYVAWGPPYTPGFAAKTIAQLCTGHPGARAAELCRSKGGLPVPMCEVSEGERPAAKRFGVWVQARQHAWESGSSWVAQGFTEWLLGETEEARWVREHAETSVVPIMDVDNVATGNGGKDALPHDHNRDWSDIPHWNETRAALARVKALVAESRMDVFLDLHNPAPGDPTFFFVLDGSMMTPEAQARHGRFIELAYKRISTGKPFVPMSNRPKYTGPNYHPRWREISANWVALNGNPHSVGLCLETIWNSPASTVEGYRSVGARLGLALWEYLKEQPVRE